MDTSEQYIKMCDTPEIQELLSILEAELPASPVDPGNHRLQSGLQGELRRYFLALLKALTMDKITMLYYSQVEK